jgi:hypothetical protein
MDMNLNEQFAAGGDLIIDDLDRRRRRRVCRSAHCACRR